MAVRSKIFVLTRMDEGDRVYFGTIQHWQGTDPAVPSLAHAAQLDKATAFKWAIERVDERWSVAEVVSTPSGLEVEVVDG